MTRRTHQILATLLLSTSAGACAGSDERGVDTGSAPGQSASSETEAETGAAEPPSPEATDGATSGADDPGAEDTGSPTTGEDDCSASDGGLDEGGGGGFDEGGAGCPEPEPEPEPEPLPTGSHCGLWVGEWACDEGQAFETFVCGTPVSCDAVAVTESFSGEIQIANPSAATCVLEALRDGLSATHAIHFESEEGYSVEDWRLEAFGDGTIVVRLEDIEDKCMYTYETWAPLRPATFFEACLADPDPAATFACLTDAADDTACVEAPVVCPGA